MGKRFLQCQSRKISSCATTQDANRLIGIYKPTFIQSSFTKGGGFWIINNEFNIFVSQRESLFLVYKIASLGVHTLFNIFDGALSLQARL